MNVLLVGMDVAPSKAFQALQQELEGRGVTVQFFLGFGNALPLEKRSIASAVAQADILLTGMSSFEKESAVELAFISEAIKKNVPWGAYQDTYGTLGRAQFQAALSQANFLFVIDENEKQKAKDMFPEEVKIVVVGNPTWDEYFFPATSREQVRQKLGIEEEEILVLIPGVKSLMVELPLISATIDAIKASGDKSNYCVVFSPHPGSQILIQAYQELDWCQDNIRVRMVPKEEMSGNEILPGSDLVVSSVSSLIIGAACQRINLIGWLNQFELNRQQELNGQEIWPPMKMQLGPILTPGTGHLLKNKIYRAGTIGQYHRNQEKLFPKPIKPGQTLIKMADYLIAQTN